MPWRRRTKLRGSITTTEEITGNGLDNQICYTGGIYDEKTPLYYLNARYYDPANGRFISQDKYRGELNEPGQWHLYAYCANNPINYVDPSGHVLAPIHLYKTWRALGFVWDTKQGKFYTRKSCIQYKLGYCDAYDRVGMKVCDIETAISKFKYNNRWWRIQLWKGRYGLTNGGEIGIYTSKTKTGWFRCAKPSEMLKMNISLRNMKTGKTLFTRSSGSQTHWWLNGFKPGAKINKNSLKLSGSITLKSKTMANKFRKNAESHLKTSNKDSRKVGFSWQ